MTETLARWGEAFPKALAMSPKGESASKSQAKAANASEQGDVAQVNPGSITLARHGQPALSRRCLLSSAQYRDWWGRYEEGGLTTGQVPPDDLLKVAREADVIYASSRRRARETAHAVVEPGRRIDIDPLFIEAPLPPPSLPSWFKMSPRLWGVVSRFSWQVLDQHKDEESHAEASRRAEQASELLIEQAMQGRVVLVLAHGYFNHMIGRELQARGWRLTRNQGFKYWCQRRFERK